MTDVELAAVRELFDSRIGALARDVERIRVDVAHLRDHGSQHAALNDQRITQLEKRGVAIGGTSGGLFGAIAATAVIIGKMLLGGK